MDFIKKASEQQDLSKLDKLLIFSRPGLGKTSISMTLPNSIIFDYEDSSGFYSGNSDVVNIKRVVEEFNSNEENKKAGKKIGVLGATKMVINAIRDSGKKYDFCIIDSLSKIDELAEQLGLANYKATPAGKDYKEPLLNLSYGAGYTWHREAFKEIISLFDGIGHRYIYLGHLKDSSIRKEGNDVAVSDLNITGSLKHIFVADMHAACTLELNKDEPNIRFLNFKKSEDSIGIKCRVQHLRDQIVPISTINDKGEMQTHWERVFLNLKK